MRLDQHWTPHIQGVQRNMAPVLEYFRHVARRYNSEWLPKTISWSHPEFTQRAKYCNIRESVDSSETEIRPHGQFSCYESFFVKNHWIWPICWSEKSLPMRIPIFGLPGSNYIRGGLNGPDRGCHVDMLGDPHWVDK